mmetsp:Transcript_37654/g.72962  ORF Transcript_37654/g.72962 Transcript_37654/m.72962 type:complete len:117 (+) Transcript_37654:1644-1994(+)
MWHLRYVGYYFCFLVVPASCAFSCLYQIPFSFIHHTSRVSLGTTLSLHYTSNLKYWWIVIAMIRQKSSWNVLLLMRTFGQSTCSRGGGTHVMVAVAGVMFDIRLDCRGRRAVCVDA